MNLNFRNRIALFTALAAAITIGLVFVLVYGVVYYSAYNHLDEDIRREKQEVLKSLRWSGDSILTQSIPEWEEKEHQQVEVNPIFLQVVDSLGDLLFRSANLQQNILLFNPNLSEDAFFNSRIGKRRIRQGQFPIFNQQGLVLGQLTVGVSQEESAIVLRNLLNTLCIAFPLLLIILFVSTAFAASKGIEPVQKLIQAAAGMREMTIDNRLPLPPNKDEIYQLATTINELLQRVDSGIQREKQFTADASHEIRTPLTAIRGTLEVLIRRPREPIQYQEKISRVINEVDRLHGMLDQLLQLARLEAGQIAVSSTELALLPFFQGLADKWQAPLQEKNMRIQLDIPPTARIHTDASLLGIILDNLVGNAIKYGQTGGAVGCRWQPESATLTISDNGVGIPADQLRHVFDRFYRTDDSRNSATPGAGLGLSIAKKLADLQGIGLSVSSQEGVGTSFALRFF